MAFSHAAATLCVALLSLCAICHAGIIRLEDEQVPTALRDIASSRLCTIAYAPVVDLLPNGHGHEEFVARLEGSVHRGEEYEA